MALSPRERCTCREVAGHAKSCLAGSFGKEWWRTTVEGIREQQVPSGVSGKWQDLRITSLFPGFLFNNSHLDIQNYYSYNTGVAEIISQMATNNLHSTSGLIYLTHQAMNLNVQVICTICRYHTWNFVTNLRLCGLILRMTTVLSVTQFQEWIQNSLNHLHSIQGPQLREGGFQEQPENCSHAHK